MLGLEYSQTNQISKRTSVRLDYSVMLSEEQDGEEQYLGFVQKIALVLKFRILQQFKLYTGIDFSIDGVTFLIGFKIAGVKVILPWTGVDQYMDIEPNTLHMPVYFGIGYLMSCYILTKFHDKGK